MESPHLDEFGERELLGSGPCGAVFRAVRQDGEALAVKLLDGMAINRPLLERACGRLEQGEWPRGVLRVIEADFRARPATCITPCLAEPGEGGRWVPRSLQHRLEEFPGEESWPVVTGLMDALAAMHDRQVAHGNLKPGNVFFDDGGGVVLVDWALGRMPGTGHVEFTDACLYQPPEQLRSVEGYDEEQGYRWDVYGFGVLAFRVLTGAFPRSDETFQQVAPLPGEISREGIAADYPRIARVLEEQSTIEWPSEPANRLEECYREIIDRCLALDPLARPANAMEVSRLFREAEVAVAQEEKLDAVLDQHRRARKLAWRVSLGAGVLAVLLVLAVALWQLTRQHWATKVESMLLWEGELQHALADTRSERDAALEAEGEARETLQRESTTWLARIEESRAIGDRLFAWALEKGHRRLPPLDGRERRLERLEQYFERFIERTAEVEELEDDRARARLQLAEIALAKGDAEEAAARLGEAMETVDLLEGGASLELRLATDRVILALLRQESNDPQTDEAFAIARKALEAVPQSEVDPDRVAQLLAILDIHESRQLAIAGDEPGALDMLHRATESLNRLAAGRPESVILRSELVSCYLSSATILDGMGELGDARTVRSLAAEKLLELIKEQPGDLTLRLELAGCYGEIAQASLLAGDVGAAEGNSKAAVKLLEELVSKEPDNVEARSRLAAQRGLMAGILRDRGESGEALALYDEGLMLLEGLTVGEQADPMAKFRFALLTWEKGRMLGFDGKRTDEIEHEQRAAEMLQRLLDSAYGVSRGEQIRRSLGYLRGDLGHAAQLAGLEDLAAQSFRDGVKIWEELVRERPGSEEYDEALEWTRQRLEAVAVK